MGWVSKNCTSPITTTTTAAFTILTFFIEYVDVSWFFLFPWWSHCGIYLPSVKIVVHFSLLSSFCRIVHLLSIWKLVWVWGHTIFPLPFIVSITHISYHVSLSVASLRPFLLIKWRLLSILRRACRRYRTSILETLSSKLTSTCNANLVLTINWAISIIIYSFFHKGTCLLLFL